MLEKLNTPVAVLVVLVLFLAADGFLFYRYQQTLRDTESAAATQLNPEVKLAPWNTSASPRKEAEELRVIVRVVGAPAGLSVYEDGQLVLDQVSEPGFRQEFEAEEEITISTNNAGALWIEANGRDLGALGASGEPMTRTFTAESIGE